VQNLPDPFPARILALKVEFGQLRRTSAAETRFRRPSAAPSLALGSSRPVLSRQIRSQRLGLDLG
jgi:hypothetical protein